MSLRQNFTRIVRRITGRGVVEDTWLEAKDTKKIRGQGQGQPFREQTLSRPRTGMLETKAKDQGHRCKCSPKKKVSKIFFRRSSKKTSSKKLFKRSPNEEYKKGLRKFSARFLAFSNEILGVQKQCCRRAENKAIFEDLRLRGQGLQNVSSRTFSRPRTSSRTPPVVTDRRDFREKRKNADSRS